MNRTPRIALAALLLTSLPTLAAQWPAGVRDTFRQSCEQSAGEALGKQRAPLYCNCTVERIDRDFSSTEIAALEKTQLPEPLIQRLQQISAACLQQLGG